MTSTTPMTKYQLSTAIAGELRSLEPTLRIRTKDNDGASFLYIGGSPKDDSSDITLFIKERSTSFRGLGRGVHATVRARAIRARRWTWAHDGKGEAQLPKKVASGVQEMLRLLAEKESIVEAADRAARARTAEVEAAFEAEGVEFGFGREGPVHTYESGSSIVVSTSARFAHAVNAAHFTKELEALVARYTAAEEV